MTSFMKLIRLLGKYGILTFDNAKLTAIGNGLLLKLKNSENLNSHDATILARRNESLKYHNTVDNTDNFSQEPLSSSHRSLRHCTDRKPLVR